MILFIRMVESTHHFWYPPYSFTAVGLSRRYTLAVGLSACPRLLRVYSFFDD